ncbi:MAG TPA: type IV pilin protein [Steroidobacteraceae bacterium]|nr:type IV pilin protein [Steroidobacteraceae bacterium]
MTQRATTPRRRGFTLAEVLTALIVVAVLAAIAIPTWRNHLLRVRRAEAISALTALQAEQDRYFGIHARYADSAALSRKPPEGLGRPATSERGFYGIELHTADDGLSYTATARSLARPGDAPDTRCVQLSIDHVGIRRAQDAGGTDRSADCWR